MPVPIGSIIAKTILAKAPRNSAEESLIDRWMLVAGGVGDNAHDGGDGGRGGGGGGGGGGGDGATTGDDDDDAEDR